MTAKTKAYDLGRPLQTMDGRPITPKMIGMPPTWDEIQSADDDDDECAKVPSYVDEPCPIARALRFLCILDEKPEEDSKKSTKKRRQEVRADKEKRFDLAMTLMQAMRKDGASSVELSKDDVETLIGIAADKLSTEPFGCILNALRTPIVSQDPDADDEPTDTPDES